MMPASRAAIVWRKATSSSPKRCGPAGLDVQDADDPVVPIERHRQHPRKLLDVEPADPRETGIDGDVFGGDRGSGGCHAPRDPLAPGEADPADLRTIQPVRGRQREPRPVVVGEVERADLDAHRGGRAVDDGTHQLVPVTREGRKLGDLVEERELVERAGRPCVRRSTGAPRRVRRSATDSAPRRDGRSFGDRRAVRSCPHPTLRPPRPRGRPRVGIDGSASKSASACRWPGARPARLRPRSRAVLPKLGQRDGGGARPAGRQRLEPGRRMTVLVSSSPAPTAIRDPGR